MTDIPEDWVLIEGATRFQWTASDMVDLRNAYSLPSSSEECGYSALCDMIAKHDTKPADPDECLVANVINAFLDATCAGPKSDCLASHPRGVAAAVAQYKKERGNG